MRIHYLACKSESEMEAAARILCRDGLVFFRDIFTEEDALNLAARFGTIVPHRDSEPSGLTRIKVNQDISDLRGFRGFSTNTLPPHTDRSSLESPPQLLLQVCKHESGTGGESTFVCVPSLIAELRDRHPALLNSLTSDAHSIITDGSTTYRGPLLQKLEGQYRFRFRMDNCIYVTPELASQLHALNAIISRLTSKMVLQEGCAYLVHNRWWLHGRTTFAGTREMWRLMINGHDDCEWSEERLGGFPEELICA